ncbi:hypothetical protein SAMN04488007_0824 [Maribacter aquivivus]|uniref:Uncharacterized protein n=1 Tax=Maribacter aquivivus TaxID=228958 RepID=A0A1M6KKX4_9FLAO|nr:hypothetical protein SAMN04488007_0824 [Maribacter aquivivus]
MVILLIYNSVTIKSLTVMGTRCKRALAKASKALPILLNYKKEIMRKEEHSQDLWFLYF